jgi:hypothetical protein
MTKMTKMTTTMKKTMGAEIADATGDAGATKPAS